jgi:hypothetical protein
MPRVSSRNVSEGICFRIRLLGPEQHNTVPDRALFACYFREQFNSIQQAFMCLALYVTLISLASSFRSEPMVFVSILGCTIPRNRYMLYVTNELFRR